MSLFVVETTCCFTMQTTFCFAVFPVDFPSRCLMMLCHDYFLTEVLKICLLKQTSDYYTVSSFLSFLQINKQRSFLPSYGCYAWASSISSPSLSLQKQNQPREWRCYEMLFCSVEGTFLQMLFICLVLSQLGPNVNFCNDLFLLVAYNYSPRSSVFVCFCS